MSLRQAKRIRNRYLSEGQLGLISKHCGKVSPNRIKPKLKADVLRILQREEYAGFGPTFAKEKLQQRNGYYLSEETLRQWMIEAGLWRAKARRKRKIYQRRVRRGRFGELLQGDGSRYAWFEDRGEECTIVIFIDDATSRLTAGKFVLAETTCAYQEILEEHLEKYGRPLGFYIDKHSIFRVSREYSGVKRGQTHFARVLQELDIELICAHSPQAKGRVERANGTLQDRLIKELRLRKISTIEAANEYLPLFMEEYNQKFGVEPRNLEDAHRPLRKQDNLERIFARRPTRKISKDLSFQYEGTFYQIEPKLLNRLRATHVNILERPGKPILIEANGKKYPYTQWKSQQGKPKVLDSKELKLTGQRECTRSQESTTHGNEQDRRGPPWGLPSFFEEEGADVPSKPCVLKTFWYQDGNILTLV